MAELHCLLERLLEEDQVGALLDVIAPEPEHRQSVRRCWRELGTRLGQLAGELSRSPHFLVQREALRALGLAADSNVQLLRDRVGELVQQTRKSAVRRQAAGALARLLDRLRLGDAEGFLEMAWRLALQPAKIQQRILERVIELSPNATARSHLALLERTNAELVRGLAPIRIAARIEDLLRGGLGLWPETSAEAARGVAPHPVAAALGELVRVFRYLGGDRLGGSLAGLGPALETLARCEHNLLWDGDLPTPVQGLAASARGLGDHPTPRRLIELASGLETELASALARSLASALRRAAKARERRLETRRQDQMRPGDVLHGYEVAKVLSLTHCSVVGVGLCRRTRRPVILKCARPQICLRPVALDLFLREGLLLQLLPHEHVVRVEQVFEDGPPMLAIQYLPGRTLNHHLGMDCRWLLRRSLDVLRGLRHVHEFGVVHRDLKPANVMVVPSGRAVLIDFGVAYLAPPAASERAGQAEPVAGTPAYMAPEQWLSRPPVPATDIYALGGILYQILAGRLPFADDHWGACCAGHLRDDPAPLGDRVHPALRDMVRWMLAKDPAARPRSEDVREAIEWALAEGTGDWIGGVG
ncbi:MAG: serine/threonine protein kinase [Deltaproteobacteria bacterium]|nr:serine/threonine protein kinase [Deltaproteobacteria bacterium]